jgi:hypothetical protein
VVGWNYFLRDPTVSGAPVYAVFAFPVPSLTEKLHRNRLNIHVSSVGLTIFMDIPGWAQVDS